MDLRGKVAIVTAAAGAGIGHAVAHKLLKAGADVMLTDSHPRRSFEVAQALSQEFSREVPACQVDVTKQEQIESAVKTTMEHFGHIDILCNVAGINKLEPIWSVSEETWRFVMNVCLDGTFRFIRTVLPHMLPRQQGAIVNISSADGWIGSSEGEAAYCAAKAGVMGLTRAAAAEVGKYNIRVNAIAPGLIYNAYLEKIYPKEFFTETERLIPLGRVGTPEEVADLVCFLVSEEARYITGEVIAITGGRYMHA
ncbi:MAG: short chain dehydrogenase [Sulfobacillus acidophilus]|uniref:Short chain dehydrogenase n=1 Tax=Sulfobacillus acidophilus TaxID=53633 RepID=A0A2T2WND2_9FIRM|nr:MAG: short chain dehydrogenase [Sulfobacillus acidophilus]